MTQVEVLRKACAANNLGTSGSAAILLARLVKSCSSAKTTKSPICKTSMKKQPTKQYKTDRKHKKPDKKQPTKKAKKACTPRAVYKTTGKAGVRLSAAYYFYEVCNGKVSKCSPQPIRQPDGSVKMKQIRLCAGPGGKKCPRWVLV